MLLLAAFAGFLENARGKGICGIIKLIVIGFISLIPFLIAPNLVRASILIIGYVSLIIAYIFKNHFKGRVKSKIFTLIGGGLIILFTSILTMYNSYKLEDTMLFPKGASINSFETQKVLARDWLSRSNLFGGAEIINGHNIHNSIDNVTSDYILTNIIATFGWVAGILLVLIIALFITKMFIITSKIKNEYGFYLCLASCTVLSVQFIINILMNLSLLPVTNISLPLVSAGGSNYVVNMALVGIILSVWRRNNLISTSLKSIEN